MIFWWQTARHNMTSVTDLVHLLVYVMKHVNTNKCKQGFLKIIFSRKESLWVKNTFLQHKNSRTQTAGKLGHKWIINEESGKQKEPWCRWWEPERDGGSMSLVLLTELFTQLLIWSSNCSQGITSGHHESVSFFMAFPPQMVTIQRLTKGAKCPEISSMTGTRCPFRRLSRFHGDEWKPASPAFSGCWEMSVWKKKKNGVFK